MEDKKIKIFVDLIAWKEAHLLVLEVYNLTKAFPKSELYGLVNQMRRCAVSITSNIAEGFSKKSKKEKNQFYYTALGSTTELQNQLLIARDVGYLSEKQFSSLAKKTVKVHKLINGLIKSSQSNT